MGVVFVNYRAKDHPLGAAGIHGLLARRFGASQVFRDSVSMAPGDHYPTRLREGLERANVLVAVIGPRWNQLTDEQGGLLIQRDRDWVRWEIARAIERGIPIIPVLLRGTPDNATPPDREILPASIRKLAEYQTFEVSQKRFDADVDRLADRLVELVPSLIPVGVEPDPAGPGRGLPRDTASFTGRTAELDQMIASLDEAKGGVLPIFAVDGMAGVGKSAFAIRAAHRLAVRFPDGQVFLPLHAHSPGTRAVSTHAALATLLLADGLDPRNLPDDTEARAGLWRARTAGRRMLLVLDDAAGSSQVRSLMPAAPGTLVLVTSRRRLDGLEDVIPLSLAGLPPADAAALIVRLARRTSLDTADTKIAELANICGFLPLALSISAARLASRPSFTVADLLTQFASAKDRLGALTGGERSVAAALELSYQDLDQPQRRLLRLLGAHPGDSYEPEAAAALLDTDDGTACTLLNALEGHRLVDETAPGRYRMHDLVREYVAHTARHDPQEHDAALIRLLEHYVGCCPQDSVLRGFSVQELDPQMAWLRAERENLLACIDYAYRAGWHTYVLRLSDAIHPVLHEDGPWNVAVAVQTRAADLAEQFEDGHRQAIALDNRGRTRWIGGHLAEGQNDLTEALTLYEQVGDQRGQASTLLQLGHLSHGYADADADALDAYGEALDLYKQVDDLPGQARAHHAVGLRCLDTGRHAEAEAAFTEALDLYTQLGDLRWQTSTLLNLGQVLMETGRQAEAKDFFAKGLDQTDRWQDQVYALTELGRLRQIAGDQAGADALLRKAKQIREANLK